MKARVHADLCGKLICNSQELKATQRPPQELPGWNTAVRAQQNPALRKIPLVHSKIPLYTPPHREHADGMHGLPLTRSSAKCTLTSREGGGPVGAGKRGGDGGAGPTPKRI